MGTRRDVVLGGACGLFGSMVARWVGAAEIAPKPAASAPESGTLGAIRAVTLTAPNLEEVERAWTRFMDYRVISRGQISRTTAAGWDAPAVAGSAYLILGPASGEPTYLRFIQHTMAVDESAHGTLGWKTTEITVENTDTLYERLKDSPFRVSRPPAAIPTYSYLRAMHAVGPAGEQLNLTWITEPRPDLAPAKSFVGRCFITVLGAPDLPGALKFYQTVFGNAPSPIRQLPSLQLAVVKLAEGAKIEIDQDGPNARVRPRPPGGLPAGLAVVTFDCSSFQRLNERFIAQPAKNQIEPFPGKMTATLRGPAGELIEILQA